MLDGKYNIDDVFVDLSTLMSYHFYEYAMNRKYKGGGAV